MSNLPHPYLLSPFSNPFTGEISVPGSKSITNRVFPLAALCEEPVEIFGALESEDAELMRKALTKMGADIQLQITNYKLQIDGNESESSQNFWRVSSGEFFTQSSDEEIFCGNSGTTLRFLTAVCLLRSKGTKTTLTGVERMKERPIGDLVDALKQMGAEITYTEKEGFPPLTITGMGKSLPSGKIQMKGNMSSQFFTAVLQIAAFCTEPLEIKVVGELVSKPYIEMSIRILESFGVHIKNNNFESFTIVPQKYISPKTYSIEGDASGASYPLAIGAITGGQCTVKNIPHNSLQGDSAFQKQVIEKMRPNVGAYCNTPLQPLGDIDLEDMPDVAMTAVVLAAYAKGHSKITGLSTLRHKECDRIWALEKNLKAMGADITTGPDWIEVNGDPNVLHGAQIETFNDHRVAMCFAVLGSMVEGVSIENPKCVEKTYPTFWEEYERWKALAEG